MGKVVKPGFGETQWERHPFRDRILRLINQDTHVTGSASPQLGSDHDQNVCYELQQYPETAPAAIERPLSSRFVWPFIDPENLRVDRNPDCFVSFAEEMIRSNAHTKLPTSDEIEQLFLEEITDRGLDALELVELRLQVYQKLKFATVNGIEDKRLMPNELQFTWDGESGSGSASIAEAAQAEVQTSRGGVAMSDQIAFGMVGRTYTASERDGHVQMPAKAPRATSVPPSIQNKVSKHTNRRRRNAIRKVT